MSPFAKSRLKEVGEYIAKEYPRTALKVVDEIFHSVDRLEQFPLVEEWFQSSMTRKFEKSFIRHSGSYINPTKV